MHQSLLPFFLLPVISHRPLPPLFKKQQTILAVSEGKWPTTKPPLRIATALAWLLVFLNPYQLVLPHSTHNLQVALPVKLVQVLLPVQLHVEGCVEDGSQGATPESFILESVVCIDTCTYGRAPFLGEKLHRLAHQCSPHENFLHPSSVKLS